MSTIILAQFKKFQNRFWKNIALLPPLAERKRLESPINQISDRTLHFDFKKAWKILAFKNAEAQSAEASKDEKLKFRTQLRLLNEIRTFFEENPEAGF